MCLVAAAPAPAATLGQLAAGPEAVPCTNVTRVQDSAATNSYTAPAAGVITSWSTRAGAIAGQMRLKVMRRTADPAQFAVVGESGLETLSPASVNTFSTSLPVQAGDLIGVRTEGGAACAFPTTSPSDAVRSQLDSALPPPLGTPPSDPGTGGTASLVVSTPSTRLNVSAELDTGGGSGSTTDPGGSGPGGSGPGGSGPGDPGADDPLGAAADPIISGPSKAATVRVDSKGRFRVGGVWVACPPLSPGACSVNVLVSTANGSTVRFVKRSFKVAPGGLLNLTKLKVSKKGLRALRSMRVARVVASLTAARPGGTPTARVIGLKLKPAKKR